MIMHISTGVARRSLLVRMLPYRLESVPASLPEFARKRLAAALRERILPRFAQDGESASSTPRSQKAQSAAARALNISASAINRLVNNEQGGSVEMAHKIAHYLKEDPAYFLTEGKRPAAEGPALRELHGYEEALHEARKRVIEEGRDVSAEALLMAGDTRMIPPLKRVTAQLLVTLAVEHQHELTEDRAPKRKGRKK